MFLIIKYKFAYCFESLTYLYALFTTETKNECYYRFSVSYYNKHITTAIPYISDSGSFQPESCIFGQALNICSVLSIENNFINSFGY